MEEEEEHWTHSGDCLRGGSTARAHGGKGIKESQAEHQRGGKCTARKPWTLAGRPLESAAKH